MRSYRYFLYVMLLLAWFTLPIYGQSSNINIQPSKDNTLFEDANGNLMFPAYWHHAPESGFVPDVRANRHDCGLCERHGNCARRPAPVQPHCDDPTTAGCVDRGLCERLPNRPGLPNWRVHSGADPRRPGVDRATP